MKEKIVLAPQKGPQEMFLATSADICIYGGAAGGGKTFGLLLEPLRYMNNPDYNAKNTAVYALRANIDIHRLRSVKPVAFAATRICRSIHSSTIRRHTEEYQNARVIPGRRRQSR